MIFNTQKSIKTDLSSLFVNISYPSFLGVEGGVHGELPSLYDPPNGAPCLFRTAFSKLIVDALNPYLKDCVKCKGSC